MRVFYFELSRVVLFMGVCGVVFFVKVRSLVLGLLSGWGNFDFRGFVFVVRVLGRDFCGFFLGGIG